MRREILTPLLKLLSRGLPSTNPHRSGHRPGTNPTLFSQPLYRNVQWCSEAGSYLRLIYSCVTQLKAQGPSRTCNESKEEEEEEFIHMSHVGGSDGGLALPEQTWARHRMHLKQKLLSKVKLQHIDGRHDFSQAELRSVHLAACLRDSPLPEIPRLIIGVWG